MARFILAVFALLGWAFYELSGGAEFEPASARVADVATTELEPAQVADASAASSTASVSDPVEVTRVALNLTSVEDVSATPRAADQNAAIEVAAVEAPQVTQAVQIGQDVAIVPSLITNATAQVLPDPIVAEPQVTRASFNEVRVVNANRVNVRGGPGTSYAVTAKLLRGDRVEILEDTGTGWVRFETADGATSGWLADFLLSAE